MARPRKTGLDYFPLDCVMDQKIQGLLLHHGSEGFGLWIMLLQECYQTENGEFELSGVIRRKTIGKLAALDDNRMDNILNTCCELNLLDKQAWSDHKIITSDGIKRRIQVVEKEREDDRKRRGISYPVDNSRKRGESKVNKTKVKETKIYTKPPTPLQGDFNLPDNFNSQKVKDSLTKFLQYRKEIGKPFKSNQSIQSLITSWSKIGQDSFIAAVEQSISNGWVGLFEAKSKPKKSNLDILNSMEEKLNEQEPNDSAIEVDCEHLDEF